MRLARLDDSDNQERLIDKSVLSAAPKTKGNSEGTRHFTEGMDSSSRGHANAPFARVRRTRTE